MAISAEPGTYGRVTSYAVLHADGGLSGLATAISDMPSLNPYLSQSADTLYVTLLRPDLPLQPYSETANGWGFGGAFDRVKVGAQGDLANAARELTALTDDALGRALDALSGEIHASATQMAAIDGESIMDTVRALLAGTPVDAGTAWTAVAWCVAISAASYLWARRLFDRTRVRTV